MSKGLAYAAIAAVIGAVGWVMVIQLTGWSLWILAPIVGGGAGYGMMRGTQMRGGLPAGVLAAAVTLAAIVAARYFIVTGEVQDRLAFDESEIIDEIAYAVADEWVREGYEVYHEEEGDFLPRCTRRRPSAGRRCPTRSSASMSRRSRRRSVWARRC